MKAEAPIAWIGASVFFVIFSRQPVSSIDGRAHAHGAPVLAIDGDRH